ncbi:MAG TPA: fumarylacetoacetate hydrolase family protein, partial [Bacteroidia bacterium]|nr:fumarylacetoacetate hydrolase family protein [Bacteroidia bacterium]
MKLVSYSTDNHTHLGIFYQDKIYNLGENALALNLPALPDEMTAFLRLGETAMNEAKSIDAAIKKGHDKVKVAAASSKDLMAPVPNPTSCRDGYAFRQ